VILAEKIRDERGTTLIELMVALATGIVILFAVTTVLIVSLRETGRITSRVNAVQNARLTLSKVVDQLHSACIAPQIAPIQEQSTGTSLRFIHQTGSAVAPTPILSVVSLTGSTLSQSDYAATGGAAPKWTFAPDPYSTRRLMTGISPTPPSSSIFSYYVYSGPQISMTPLSVIAPLDEANAATVVKVGVAFTASPSTSSNTPVDDPNAPASVQNSAVLRLTPASYHPGAVNLPCQ
jgi:Tfp pilus assembly protein PilW